MNGMNGVAVLIIGIVIAVLAAVALCIVLVKKKKH